jgi:hypothetical protein
MSGNPFLGPQPYRAADRARFFGREEVTRKLSNHILAYPCVTLFGPSGAGKSSLMQAGVLPLLEDAHDSRVVYIEGWLKEEAPLERLVWALFRQLELGAPPEELTPAQGLEAALELAEQQSSRPLLIYLDQFEQLFQQGRDAARTEELLKNLRELARGSLRGMHLVLALREDYLGRFRDRARGRRELLEQGFRLGPLTVAEMVKVACRIAATVEPQRPWEEDGLRELMLQVRVAGQDKAEEAEVQAAFAQIVCRALWEERAKGSAPGSVQAEPMLHQYLETTLEELGPLKVPARRLLEEHLVASDGSRTLLMEQQARTVLAGLSEAEASTVLTRLESAAVLHAEEHQGSRYFELGHDWLARKVLELRQERERKEQEEERLRQEQARQEEEKRKQREEQERRMLLLKQMVEQEHAAHLAQEQLNHEVLDLRRELKKKEQEEKWLRQELARQEEEALKQREEQEQREKEMARKLQEEHAARRRLALVAGGAVVVAVAVLMGLVMLWALR